MMGKKETIHLCTLFDSNYLDKGLALYSSLEKTCGNFILYIFAFDDISYGILKKLNLKHTHIIGLSEFETDELSAIKKERSKGEYCWTCTPVIIEYILDKFQADICTYVDSDIFFYKSPAVLLREFEKSNCSVGLVGHRFPKTAHGRNSELKSGKYCVEFNTFKNNAAGRRLLALWKALCLKECSIQKGGDQRYLTDWGKKYDEVYEYRQIGGGVAPWNLMRYRICRQADSLKVIYKKKRDSLIFYHFQGLEYSGDGRVNINLIAVPDGSLIRKKYVKMIYYPYLNLIEDIRKNLVEDYHIDNYKDGCGREFEIIPFQLFLFLKAVVTRAFKESPWSSIDLIIRVCRKKNDIINLSDIAEK